MIALTLLDRTPIVLNADQISWITSRPDTTIRLATGENLVIRESVSDLVHLIVEFRARVMRTACLPSPDDLTAALHLAAGLQSEPAVERRAPDVEARS